jgi:hypothetical protein
MRNRTVEHETVTGCEWNVEGLSARLHAIYQEEARRQAGTGEDTVRHPDDYDALPEHTKEYDRVLARFIIERETWLTARIAELEALLREAREVWLTLIWDEEHGSRPEDEDSVANFKGRIDAALEQKPE